VTAVTQTPLETAPGDLTSQQGYFLITSLVVPRPIAWVSTTDGRGGRNLAPHSYFNIASTEPLIVQFVSSHGRDGAQKRKDTLSNVLETGEFVVNVVDRAHVVQMNVTSAQMPAEEDEFWWAQVPSAPSRTVTAPRVRDAPASLECKLVEHLRIGNGT
jgi:flavin reductase (DIM6/NTAB) family NADH-FMN oxidoreductase RutF